MLGPASTGTVFYFAYGSNMLLERLRAPTRCPGAIRISNAVAENFDLAFDKESVDGSGKATIHSCTNAIVHGVIFEIPGTELSALDTAEGVGNGYVRAENFSVVTQGRALSVLTYIADKTRHGLQPYEWYLQLVVAGARQASLPKEYIGRLERVGFIPDPNPNRPTRLEALRVLANANLA